MNTQIKRTKVTTCTSPAHSAAAALLIWSALAIILVSLPLATGCKKGSDEASEGGNPYLFRAESLLEDWQNERWSEIRAEFDTIMLATLSEADLAEAHRQVFDLVGTYQSHSTGSVRLLGEYQVVDIPVQFERAEMKFRAVFNDENQVSGLFVLTPETP